MSTDVLPETQNSQARSNPQNSPGARWWKRGLLTIGVVAVVAIAAAFIPGAMSERESGPKLTHTITRGDLVVTVTEQGTLPAVTGLWESLAFLWIPVHVTRSQVQPAPIPPDQPDVLPVPTPVPAPAPDADLPGQPGRKGGPPGWMWAGLAGVAAVVLTKRKAGKG